MSDEDRNRALLRRFYEKLWTKGNVEMIPELLAEIDIVRVAGGKITEFWYGEHLLELMQQLGAVPDFAADYAAQDER
jgi:hypothetical protein